MTRSLAVVGLALSLAVLPRPATAADVPYTVTLGDLNRPVGEGQTVAFNRRGVLYMDLVRATRVFSGLLTFGKDGRTATLTIRRLSATFTLGQMAATVNGESTQLRGAPFLGPGGDFFVPIVTIAYLGGAGLRIDRAHHTVNLQLGAQTPPAPAASTSYREENDGTLEPSPAQALSFTPTASYDSAGLHVRVDVVNVTKRPYTVTFPSGAQVAFVVSKDGNEVWDSLRGKRFTQSLTTLTLAPEDRHAFADDWAGFSRAGAGRYTVRARLMTATPIDSAAVSIGVFAPSPSPSPAST